MKNMEENIKSQTTIFLEEVIFVQRSIENPNNNFNHYRPLRKLINLLFNKWCCNNGIYHIPNVEIIYPLYDKLSSLNKEWIEKEMLAQA